MHTRKCLAENKIAGKVIIITGANKGLGKALALLFCRNGAIVVAIGKDEALNRELSCEVASEGFSIEVIRADLTSVAELKSAFSQVLSVHKRIDILINNAAISYFEEVKDINEQKGQEMLDVNLRAAYLATKFCLPAMLENRSGTIVNISSIYGLRADKRTALYSMTKHGLIGFTKGLFYDYQEKGIRAIVICPTAFGENSILKTPNLGQYIISMVCGKSAINQSMILSKSIFSLKFLMFIEESWLRSFKKFRFQLA